MARISEMNDDEASATLLRAYRRACDNYDGDNDEHGRHPSKDVNRWIAISATGGTNTEKRIQSQDDDQPSLTAGGNGGNGGATPAQDGRYSLDSAGVPRFVTSAGVVTTGDAALVARANQSSPATRRALEIAIPALRRLK